MKFPYYTKSADKISGTPLKSYSCNRFSFQWKRKFWTLPCEHFHQIMENQTDNNFKSLHRIKLQNVQSENMFKDHNAGPFFGFVRFSQCYVTFSVFHISQDETAECAKRKHVQRPHCGTRQRAGEQPNLLHGERCRGQA